MNDSLSRELQTLQVIALAMAGSVVLYSAVAWFLAGPADASSDLLAPLLAAVGIGLLIVAPFAERQLRGAGAADRPTIDSTLSPEAGDQRLARYRVAKLVGFALREAAAVVGLVIALVSGDDVWCYGLGAAALISMALAWPSRPALESATGGAIHPR